MTPPTLKKPLIAISGRRWKARLIEGMPENFGDLGVDLHIGAYADAVGEADGAAITMPCSMDALDVVDYAHGLVLTGGSDVSPARYGESAHPAVYGVDDVRDEVEVALARRAIERGLPVLAICRGLQVLNVAFGGSLIQHLEPSEGGVVHAVWGVEPSTLVHGVTLHEPSLAARVYGTTTWKVNSLHHQAVARLGEGLVATAWAPDGTIEAAEMPGHPVLGVQWHPELVVDQPDPAFSWIVSEASKLR